MLTEEQINLNKEEYLSLIRSINIEGADIERFVDWLLNKSDFFEAPASTKYHCGYKGGLCEHSLNVYKALTKLCVDFANDIDDNSIKVVALLHDISKANYYEGYYRNVKDEESGQWMKVPEFRVRENKFVFGNHEQTSEFIARTFFPLSVDESAAILSHHGGMGFDSAKVDLTPIYNQYSLACLLHLADMAACYCWEKI